MHRITPAFVYFAQTNRIPDNLVGNNLDDLESFLNLIEQAVIWIRQALTRGQVQVLIIILRQASDQKRFPSMLFLL